jgi:hypothetical protein
VCTARTENSQEYQARTDSTLLCLLSLASLKLRLRVEHDYDSGLCFGSFTDSRPGGVGLISFLYPQVEPIPNPHRTSFGLHFSPVGAFKT